MAPCSGVTAASERTDRTPSYARIASTPPEPRRTRSARGSTLAARRAPIVCNAVHVRLRPGPLNRLANSSPGAVLVGFGLAALVVGDGAAKAAGVLAVLGIVLAVRGYRLAAETHHDSVTVYGMLRTRVIPRAAITQITDYPAIIWTDPAGRTRCSPVLAFLTPSGTLAGVAQHHTMCVNRLQQWAHPR